MALYPRTLLVLLIATCIGIILMGSAQASDAGGVPRAPREACSASTESKIPPSIMYHDQWSLTHA